MNDVVAVTATVALAALVAFVDAGLLAHGLTLVGLGDDGTSSLGATVTIVREATGVLVVATALVAGVACATLRPSLDRDEA